MALTLPQLAAAIRAEKRARALADWRSDTIAWRKASIRLELLEELQAKARQGPPAPPPAPRPDHNPNDRG